MIAGKSLVDYGLEHLHLLSRNPGPAQAANQLFRFAGEHRAGNDLDPTGAASRQPGMLAAALGVDFFGFIAANHSC